MVGTEAEGGDAVTVIVAVSESVAPVGSSTRTQ